MWVEANLADTYHQYLPMIFRGEQYNPLWSAGSALAEPLGVINHLCPDIYEVDDTWEQAREIVQGELQLHSFDSNPLIYSADKDVLGFDVIANDVVTFTVVTITNTQTLLEIFDENGNALNITGTHRSSGECLKQATTT